MDEKIAKLKEWIDGSDNIVFFGGAGVSTESGIRDFRSVDGLYHQKFKYPPETMLSHTFYEEHTQEFYDFYRQKLLCPEARPNAAHVKLAAQLQDHTLARTYRCIVTGNLREDTGTVNAPIGRCPADRKKMAVVAGGRNAVTHWTVLERYPGVNYVECRLETGRTHQIRVHMAYIGHPILGDTVYGNKKPVPGLQGQCLHAVGLKFIHPRTGELVELTCGLPEEFEKQLKKYRNMA